MTILVFANGELVSSSWVGQYSSRATHIIAADGGVRHVLSVGRVPDVVIGDMDSISDEDREKIESAGAKFLTYPIEKDETDLELALLYAAQNFHEDIVVLGALGGRLDQMIANILLLAHPGLNRRVIHLVEEKQEATLVVHSKNINGIQGDVVSLLPIGGDVIVEKTIGLKWKLDNEHLYLGLTRGISNVMIAEQASIFLKRGRLLCIHTRR
jgi:thiamine pyrophosphokinase